MVPPWPIKPEGGGEGGKAEDPGVKNDDQELAWATMQSVAVMPTQKNVRLGDGEDDKLDFGHFETEVPVRSTNEDLWVYHSRWEETCICVADSLCYKAETNTPL